MQRCDPVTRLAVEDRQEGRCWLCGQHRRLDMHRRLQGSLGGRYVLGNLIGACRPHHNAIHDRIEWALKRGWLVESYEDPEQVPLWTVDGWVRILDTGDVIRARQPDPAGSAG